MKNNIIKTQDNRYIKPVSRWIKLYPVEVTAKHRKAPYAWINEDHKTDTLFLFRHNGKLYCLEQFLSMSYPMFFELNDGLHHISAYDSEIWYKPYLIEISDDCEHVKLYEEAENDGL